ncbi:putative metalloprotease protein [Zalerion maritima]|uniref:Metalloprotease protein n=1 Tax=Zalerion maritima TaxID=339359 RepID=A0AAD5RIW5_9PEZI|nr:putative metalloprotease protein [Zalerion maritima]
MFVKALLSGAAMASAAMGHVIRAQGPQKFTCGAPEPTDEQISAANRFSQIESEMVRRQDNASIAATLEVETYFHVVSSSTSESDGYVSDSVLADQLAVMNSDYAPQGVSFNLAGTTRTVNSNWANDNGELAMKQSLRQGGYDALNVYFLTYLSGYLGYCYFPTSVSTGSNDFYYDGCSILWETVPGGPAAPYNEGKTVTHEVGHWFGLYHTFQGGCTGSGDYISDTPAQASASSGCPTGRDSCPSQSGVDPIHNYMDYSNDACYEEFTDGQETRMFTMWNTYRA